MSSTGLTRSLVTVGFVAFMASMGVGCDQLAPWWDEIQKGNGTGSSGAGAGGTSGPPSMCEKIDGGGDSTSCKTYDTWKKYGVYECEQRNMQLTDLAMGPSCGATRYQNAIYLCCGTPTGGSAGTGGSPGAGTGGSPGGGTGGASGEMCTTNRLSGATTCRTYDLWKQDASATCTKQNRLLTTITPGPECEGGIVGVTFTCCDGPVPPPPPTGSGGSSGGQMCTTSEMGGETSCKPYDVWKQYASDACAQQDALLTALTPGATCGDGLYQVIKFTCCAPTPL